MVREIPLSVIASWPTPNYIDPVRRGPGAVRLTIAFLSIVTVAVFLRVYIHIFVIRSFGHGDIFIVLAFLSTIAMTTLEIVGYERYDWGLHIWDVPINNFSRSIYISWWYRIVYSTASCFTRMALTSFYYRLTQGGHTMKYFRRWIHLVAFFSVAVGLTLVFVTIFQCSPIRAMWTFPSIKSRCINEGMGTLVCGIINTVADILVVILPIPMIYKLQLPLRKRVGAILLVSTGLSVCVVGIVRAYYVWLSLVHSYDETWDGYGALVSGTVEIHVGLLCACAPAIRVGFVKFVKPQLTCIRARLRPQPPSSKISTRLLSVNASYRPRTVEQQTKTNSVTFLATPTPDCSDNDGYFEMTSKAMAHELHKVEDIFDEKGLSYNETKPIPPPKDGIYLTQEVRVESTVAQRTDDRRHSLERWHSVDTAVEYAEAMVFARRGDIVEPPKPGAQASSPGKQSYVTLNTKEQTGIGVLSEQTATNTTLSQEEPFHKQDTHVSSPRRKRSDTLQIPERTFKLARERSLRSSK